MSIDNRDTAGDPPLFPGFSSTATSAEPFFMEIEDPAKSAPPPPLPVSEAGPRPAWLGPRSDRSESQVRRKSTPPPVPPKNPNQPVRGSRRALIVNTAAGEPKEELTWQKRALRWIQGEGGAGFGVSVLVHVVLLLLMSLMIYSLPEEEELITTLEETDVVDMASLQDVDIVEIPTDFEPQTKDPLFEPAPLSAPEIGIGTLASSLVEKPGGGLNIQIPKQAITKGSFTVWTVPEDPAPGQKYNIMIQVKLNESVKRYPRSDLSGNVVGTDGYKDYFGGPTESGYLPINGNTVLYEALPVPGASQLVKDVITVESKILKEKQVIEIVF